MLENAEKLYKMLENSRHMLANAGKHQKTQENVITCQKMLIKCSKISGNVRKYNFVEKIK